MLFSQQELSRLVAQSSSLSERLDPGFSPGELSPDNRGVESRLARWRQNAAKSDLEPFARRLAWDRLDEDAVRRALGSMRLDDDQHLPAWTHTLNGILEIVAEHATVEEAI